VSTIPRLVSAPYTVQQFAAALSAAMQFPVTRLFVYRAARDGRLEHVRAGRRILIPREQLEATLRAWMEGHPW
jgi:excisionase family DNA binding protein